jgi:hypothetical protein|tara:strand:+ start:123 stop:404 length:282 start_codon:yes stop_codon:yes gene_type:complete
MHSHLRIRHDDGHVSARLVVEKSGSERVVMDLEPDQLEDLVRSARGGRAPLWAAVKRHQLEDRYQDLDDAGKDELVSLLGSLIGSVLLLSSME